MLLDSLDEKRVGAFWLRPVFQSLIKFESLVRLEERAVILRRQLLHEADPAIVGRNVDGVDRNALPVRCGDVRQRLGRCVGTVAVGLSV